jgi:tRNA U34 5-carboxymethylaminomethyl modifying GTPase MnmE/TrmE
MAKKEKDILTKKQEKELQSMVENMLEIAANVVEEYEDLDLSELSELSGSLSNITQINENSPFLDEIFKGDSWKKIIKNIPPLPKQPKDDKEDASE